MAQKTDDLTAVDRQLASIEDGEYKKGSQLSIDSSGPICTPLASQSVTEIPIDQRKEERVKIKSHRNQKSDLTRDVPREKGRKKAGHSVNHLLNFTLSSQDDHMDSYSYQRRISKHRFSTFNKEQYLQANCQFLVREDGDYTVHNFDPDVLVHWDNIEQVRLWCHELPSCPICLYPPTAAKITRCGHIFCWPCILHYLSLTEKTWKKCPLCQEAVHQADLKSVISIAKHRYALGEDITLCLMRRQKDSTIVQVVSEWKDQLVTPFHEDYQETFSKLILITADQVITRIIQEEEMILRTALDCPAVLEAEEVIYINRALDLLQLRRKSLEVDSIRTDEMKQPKSNFPYSSNFQGTEIIHTEDVVTAEGSFQDDTRRVADKPNDIRNASNDKTALILSPDGSTDNSSYLYQAKDGQHFYLSAFNAKCLNKEYGSLKNSPVTLTAKILDIEQLSVTEEFRNRNRYLRHLPLTCVVYICELDLKQPVLSKSTLQTFSREIRQRKERRRKKILAEKRCNIDKYKDRAVPPSNTFDSFPSIGFVLNAATATSSFPPGFTEPTPEESTDSQISSLSDVTNADHELEPYRSEEEMQPSFAQALLGNAKSSSKNLNSPEIPIYNSQNEKKPITTDYNSDEGQGSIPSFRESFMNSLSNNWNINHELKSGNNSVRNAGKKKKNGKKLLFSTNNHLRYN